MKVSSKELHITIPKSKKEKSIVELLLAWYRNNGREFIWRAEYPDPYIVLVSETMLQQTQTYRIEQKLPKFLEEYPTINVLAIASTDKILRSWQGMGYNSRALRLRDCARMIVEKFGGIIPNDYDTLRSLPGVGDYTASALLAFAFRKDIPVIDVNIIRVLSRVFMQMNTTAEVLPIKTIREIDTRILPKGASSEWHQALMDIGAMFCTARKPNCTECPLNSSCKSASSMKEVVKPKKAEPSQFGVPLRIWRGRIIERLRTLGEHDWLSVIDLIAYLNSTFIDKNQLVIEPIPDYITLPNNSTKQKEHHDWITSLVEKLSTDGLVEIETSRDGMEIRLSKD
jgi:A/G-specific adenine glycosylase